MADKFVANDGTERQSYYGADGAQPWDLIFDKGWAAPFAAGNVLKYLRRNKGDPAHDTESARWYWIRLHELVGQTHFPLKGRDAYRSAAQTALVDLLALLTPEEVARLNE